MLERGRWLLLGVGLALAPVARAAEIHDAVRARNVDRIRALLVADPSLRLALDDSKRTPLHWAVMESNPALWEAAFELKAVEMFDFMGATPVHLAVMSRGSAESLTFLLERGAPADRPTRLEKATPLHWAAEQGNAKAITVLLLRGADLHARNHIGASPLHLAAGRSGDAAVVSLLLQRGAKVDATNMMGLTPLLNAAAKGRDEVVRVLLAAGADIAHRDALGRGGRALAEAGGHAAVAAMFPR